MSVLFLRDSFVAQKKAHFTHKLEAWSIKKVEEVVFTNTLVSHLTSLCKIDKEDQCFGSLTGYKVKEENFP